jgi:hypothetical protein
MYYLLFIELIFKILGYSFVVYGLWLIVSPLLNPIIQEELIKMRRKRRNKKLKELNDIRKVDTKRSFIYNHLELVLFAVKKRPSKNTVGNFIFLSAALFLISSTFLVIQMDDVIVGLFLGITLGLFPYLIARLRLNSLQNMNSMAFLSHFHMILTNYQSTGRDIYFTIINTVKQMKDSPLRQTLIKLANALQTEKNPDDFNKAVKIFIFAVSNNNNFVKRFGKLVIKAHMGRSDISKSLYQLEKDIKKRKIDMEESKTKQQDTIYLGYLPLFALPFAIFITYKFAGVFDFWYFFTMKINLTLFIICVVTSILSVLLANAVRKPKADI